MVQLSYLFDITSGQPVNTDLKQDLNLQTIKILSPTTAIVNTNSFKTLFFNVVNITTTPFIQLDQVLINFYPLSETTGIGIGSNDKTYYFEYK
ncbi:hypothetical protein [Spiroplasma sp. AdecLV25b]|uniref:hypothetical protein n=1 Tax=Spiroplasma sp. AdecLV25b TaxID=3027162 RepID=UPI0027DEAEB2|nr:hypothetical protein [Spiroplasma sp. AdecLV25b]